MFGGWALLPVASYAGLAGLKSIPLWLYGTVLPSEYFFTKPFVIGIGALAGVAFYDGGRLRQWRPQWRDLPMGLWCAAPLLSGLANELAPARIGMQVLYMFMAWGVPYLLGRLYLTTSEDWWDAARLLVLLGLAYVPLGVLEWGLGPFLYEGLYGYHPFQYDGHLRYLGYRPLLFLEHGNQLGMWMASAALIAAWVAYCRGRRRLWIPAAALLVAATVAFQSVGSIILLGAGLSALVWFTGAPLQRVRRAIMACGVLFCLLGVLHISNAMPLGALKKTWVGDQTRQFLKDVDRGSLSWRVKLDQKNIVTALQKPLLGWGKGDWWKGTYHVRPWGLWLMAWGMYGLVGLGALGLLLLWPLGLLLRGPAFDHWRRSDQIPVAALGAVLLISALDSLLNTTFIGVFVSIAGGYVSLHYRWQGQEVTGGKDAADAAAVALPDAVLPPEGQIARAGD